MGTGKRTYWLRGCWALLAVSIALAPDAAAQSTAPALPKVPADLEKLRASLQKYDDPILAVHDGYFSTLGCVEVLKAGAPGTVPTYVVGGMGIHFLNPALIGPNVDPLKPQILIYQPTGGKLHLVAAEWFVPLATGVKTRPEMFGAPFDGPMEGHHPVLPSDLHHYDLHVWLWKENPAGLFRPTNPSMTCGDYSYTVKLDAPRIVPHHGDAAKDMIGADDERYRAMIANDTATLDRLMSPDLLYTHSPGYVDTKQAYLASLRSGQVKYLDAKRDDVKTRIYGDAAYMSGIVSMKVSIGGESKVLNNRFLNVWVRNAGAWQMVAWASTPIPAK